MFLLPSGCRAFGAGSSFEKISRLVDVWRSGLKRFECLLIIAGSLTAEVKGISAAGSTADSRRYTAVADAELLLKGPFGSRSWPLPPLSAGISPAIISFVAVQNLEVKPSVISVGLSQTPPFPHFQFDLPSIGLGPAQCLSTGKAMDPERVESLWEQGYSMGLKADRPILIAECVPGGTTTAQAVLTGLGLSVDDLISGSVLNPPVKLKKKLIANGLGVADLGDNPSSKALIAAVGDPFQPVAVGLLLGARQAGQEVLLAGGSQMLAVLALSLATLEPKVRSHFVDGITIGTTAWLAEERKNIRTNQGNLNRLMDIIGDHFGVKLIGVSSGLRFHSSTQKVLRDYELGYVKEGVGAGALCFLAQLKGATCDELISQCEEAINQLKT